VSTIAYGELSEFLERAFGFGVARQLLELTVHEGDGAARGASGRPSSRRATTLA
jgi:hypothetical protein